MQVNADEAQPSDHVGTAVAHVDLAGDVVKVDPVAVLAGKNALGAEDKAAYAGVKGLKDRIDALFGVAFGCLATEGFKNLVGVVMIVMVVMAGGFLAGVAVKVTVLVAMARLAVLVVMLVMLVDRKSVV